jgi:tetratricopeptide (TPR) repeat protein
VIFHRKGSLNGGYKSTKQLLLTPKIRTCLIAIILSIVCTTYASAETSTNILYRVEVRPHTNYTRLLFKLENTPKYSITLLPGKRLRLCFQDTGSLQPKRLRSYTDPRISLVAVSQRGNNYNVIITMKESVSGYRLIDPGQTSLLVLDIGPGPAGGIVNSIPPGREQIWSGVEKMFREFQPSLCSGMPFVYSDGQLLKKILPPGDLQLFQKGEAAIYKEKAAEAEEIFGSFMKRDSPIRMIAAYRLGEALYIDQKYKQALAAFREGERLNPEYIVQIPTIIFYYADCMARNGEFEAGRNLLTRLINGVAGTNYAVSLLVGLADITAREGREMQAVAIYKNIVKNFAGNRAVNNAMARLLDRQISTVNEETYKPLMDQYKQIFASGGDGTIPEESLFKAVLLQALYGPVADAVADVADYQKKYRSGAFAGVAKTIREKLLFLQYRELEKDGDCKGLLKMVEDNTNYLAGCLSNEVFVRQVSQCYRHSGMIKEEMTLFVSLVDSEWVASSAPFLYKRIIEDAMAFKDYALVEAACRAFLVRFPRHEMQREVLERLGWICYRKKDMQAVIPLLSWLTEKGSRAGQPESYYYLGKALVSAHKLGVAEKAMTLFLEELKSKGLSSPYQSDACLISATAKLARGDRNGALAMYRLGFDTSREDLRDTFLYKMAELSGQLGNSNEARDLWKKLEQEGDDPVWKKMASQKLAEMDQRDTPKSNEK